MNPVLAELASPFLYVWNFAPHPFKPKPGESPVGWLMDVPMWAFLLALEIIGAGIKPFALMIRLFANMIAGHIVLAALILLIPVAAGIGGPENGVGGHIRGSDNSRVNLYVQVRDLQTSLERAVALGGSITLEPFDVAGGPSLAGIKDPEGNPLMLVQQ